MAKFKKGDKVRVLDGSNIKGYFGTWVPDMDEYVGREYCIEGIEACGDKTGYYLANQARKDRYAYIFDERGLELVDDKKTPRIKIYAEGDKVVAKNVIAGRTETMESLNDDCLSRLIELAKFETLMKLLNVAGLDLGESGSGLSLRDILKILVRNGCPVDALLSTLKEVGEKLKEEGGDNE